MTDISCKSCPRNNNKKFTLGRFSVSTVPFIFQAVRNIYNISGNTLMDKNIR
uniref:Uncharacterized protein n=1 Tax=Anguilla anguilla TaxID=7936 RepID=A0A0E9P7F5_ANGAN